MQTGGNTRGHRASPHLSGRLPPAPGFGERDQLTRRPGVPGRSGAQTVTGHESSSTRSSASPIPTTASLRSDIESQAISRPRWPARVAIWKAQAPSVALRAPMKHLHRHLAVLLFGTLLAVSFLTPAMADGKQTFVLVHGATAGGWEWKRTGQFLSDDGHTVYRPTLTGLGEREHLNSTEVDLATHINDVVNLVLFEDLHDVVLTGHSYGGMVVTGVMDRIPERLKHVVFLDAAVPEDGQSIWDL